MIGWLIIWFVLTETIFVVFVCTYKKSKTDPWYSYVVSNKFVAGFFAAGIIFLIYVLINIINDPASLKVMGIILGIVLALGLFYTLNHYLAKSVHSLAHSSSKTKRRYS